jgi:serine/threonine protein kinase
MNMLTGQTPFAASSDEESLARVLRGDLALPLTLPLEAHHLIMCMVEPDPKRRYTLAEVLDHPWLTGEELTVDSLIHDDGEGGTTSTNARIGDDDDDDYSDDSDDLGDSDEDDGGDGGDVKVFRELVEVMAQDYRTCT